MYHKTVSSSAEHGRMDGTYANDYLMVKMLLTEAG